LAKEIGFISSFSCEFGCGSSNLVYALIDRIEYGNRITNVKEDELFAPPNEYILYQNFPNPFNPSTTISFYLPRNSNVKLLIYDLKGALIQNLANDDDKLTLSISASDFITPTLYFLIIYMRLLIYHLILNLICKDTLLKISRGTTNRYRKKNC